MSDKDHEVLAHLDKVEFQLFPQKNDFSLTFTFKPNEFFENTVLTKKFLYSQVKEEADYPKSSEGTHINWKEGKNITVKVVQKVNMNKLCRLETKEQEDRSNSLGEQNRQS